MVVDYEGVELDHGAVGVEEGEDGGAGDVGGDGGDDVEGG